MVRAVFRAIILCLVLFLCFNSYAFSLVGDGYESEEAPNFTLEDLSGETVSLSDLQGKSVILFFWTTWCPHCRRAIQIFNTEYKGILESDIELLAIDIGEPKEVVGSYISRYSIDFPILLDFDSNIASAYGIIGVPTIVLISKEGEIVSVSNSLPRDYKELLSE